MFRLLRVLYSIHASEKCSSNVMSYALFPPHPCEIFMPPPHIPGENEAIPLECSNEDGCETCEIGYGCTETFFVDSCEQPVDRSLLPPPPIKLFNG